MMRARILSFIIWILVSLWNRTIRIEFVNRGIPDRLASEGKNFIYAFWHGRQFLLLHSHRRTGVVINASESRDGEIQARVLLHFGFSVVRGSSGRKGERALLGLADSLRKGKNVGIAVDGPRGPVHEAKPGVVFLAGKLGKPIVPVVAGARRYRILGRAWDQSFIPAPFTKGVVLYGNPIIVKDTSETELEAKCKKLDETLNTLTAQADAYYRRS